jgi:hypothetical protein
LPRDGDERHRVEERVREPGHEVRRAGAGRRDADAHFARALGVPLRGEHLALLVAAQDVSDPRGGFRERLVYLHRRAAGVGEHAVHALALERLHENIRALPRLVLAEPRLEVPDRAPRREVLHLRGREVRLREERGVDARDDLGRVLHGLSEGGRAARATRGGGGDALA